MEPIISIKDLRITYGKGKDRFKAVDGISFDIYQGDIVGFVGPNGAGKTSTIKSIMGFIFPEAGEIKVFGESAGKTESRRRMGYLPEVSLYYPYMTAAELLELYGGLHGMSNEQLKQRIPEILSLVGLSDKKKSLLKDFSKGMQQRLGIAQAIISDPELLVFDEMSSGLDPVGRHDLRNILIDLKKKGRTIFFSSHELTEVENLCNKVIIIHKGKIKCSRSVEELLRPIDSFEISFMPQDSTVILPENITRKAVISKNNDNYNCRIEGIDNYTEILNYLTQNKYKIIQTNSKRQSLEDFFMELISKEQN